MKGFFSLTLIWFTVGTAGTQDRPITALVKRLETMLTDSKTEVKETEESYAKEMCECDHLQKRDEEDLEKSSKAKKEHEADKETALGKAGKASVNKNKAVQYIAKLADDKTEQENLFTDQTDEYTTNKADFEKYIEDLGNALDILRDVGASGEESSRSNKFLSQLSVGNTLTKARTAIQNVIALSDFKGDVKTTKSLNSFLQGPSHDSQSLEVFGLLKQMQEQYERDLATLEKTYAQQTKFNDDRLEAIEKKRVTQDALRSDAVTALDEAEESRLYADEQIETHTGIIKSAQDSRDVHAPLCEEKKVLHAKAIKLLKGEQVALSKAISILNSDEAFESFGHLSMFIQTSSVSIRSHDVFAKAKEILSQAKSERVLRIATAFSAGTPFDVILKKMEDMKVTIDNETAADHKQHDDCTTLMNDQHQIIVDAETDIATQDNHISTQEGNIADEEGNIEAELTTIKEKEDSIKAERDACITDHAKHVKEGNQYVAGISLVTHALDVIKSYFEKLNDQDHIDEMFKSEAHTHADAEVSTERKSTSGDFSYEGHKTSGQSSGAMEVVTALGDIKADYKVSLGEVYTMDATRQQECHTSIDEDGRLRKESKDRLKTAKQQLLDAKEKHQTAVDEKKTQKEIKATAMGVIAHNKPSCDWINDHLLERTEHRESEKSALDGAIATVKGTDLYIEAKQHDDMQKTKCKKLCTTYDPATEQTSQTEDNAPCQACMAGVDSVKTWCTSNSDYPDCTNHQVGSV